jgi:hypothetical protein
MPETIDQFNPARTPYTDADLFGIGYGGTPTSTYKGTLVDLFTYLQKRLGTGQLTLVGNANYTMLAPTSTTQGDFELATSAALTLSPTWTLMPANSIAAGQRRRIVDLAGVIVPSVYQIAVAPAGSDRINGLNTVVWLAARFGYVNLETDGVSNWTIVEAGPSLVSSNNLSELSNPATARSNLGLGTASTYAVTDFLWPVNNLSDLPNKTTARGNLGLGGLAVLNSVLYGNLDPSMIATSADVANATPNKLVPSNVVLGSKTPVIIPWAASVTWDFNTFINGLYTLTGGNTTSITVANPKPGQTGFIIIRNNPVTPAHTLAFPSIVNFVTSTSTISPSVNTANLFEYWIESVTVIRARLTANI